MSASWTRLPHRALLLVAGIAAGTLGVGLLSCRREAAPSRGANGVEFRAGKLDATDFSHLIVVQDRLWVTTDRGVAVIDPVGETWTRLVLGSEDLHDVRVIPCGPDIWLLDRDYIVLLNLKKQTFRSTWEGQGTPLLRDVHNAFCANDGLWLYVGRDGGLFKVPASGMATARYQTRGAGATSAVFYLAESLQGSVYFLAPQYASGQPPNGGLFRFDPSTSQLTQVELPASALPFTLERTDEGLFVRTQDSKTFFLKAEGQPWVEVPQRYAVNEPVLAEGNGVVWVGASYDVSPASYFVLRYIRDAMEPKDLVILPRNPPYVGPHSAVQYLGMLWAVSGTRVLRIDPNAEELASYELTDSTGKLRKQVFPLTKDSAGVRYFDGNTLVQFPGSQLPGSQQESPEARPDTEPL